MQLSEQYRPARFEDVIGQDKVIARIAALRKRGLGGRAYFLTGSSGTGKTTIARLLAAEIAEPLMISEVDAPGLAVSDLEDIERTAQIYGWGGEKRGRAFIFNEAHALRKSVIEKLLTMLERIPAHVVFIFTTTCDGAVKFDDFPDGKPFIDRCTRLDLARRDLAKPFAEALLRVAQREGWRRAAVPGLQLPAGGSGGPSGTGPGKQCHSEQSPFAVRCAHVGCPFPASTEKSSA